MSQHNPHKLALILGSPKRDLGEDDSPDEYQQARYAFDDGFVSGKTHFFGRALLEYLGTREATPDSVLVMGTSGSIWNTLVPAFGDVDAHTDLWCELHDEVRDENIDRDDLDRIERFLDERLENISFGCRLVGPATDRDEQLEILETLSGFVDRGDELTLDITHGLRSMGYSALAAGRLLHRTRDVALRDVYYGNYAMKTDDGAATAVRISALDDLSEWATAVASFRRTGLLGNLPELVGREHPQLETPLRKLNHALVTNRFGAIQDKARQALATLADLEVDGHSPFSLFRPDLADELRRLQQTNLIDLQLDLAERALSNNDYLRATICQFEAVVSAAIEEESTRRDGYKRMHAGDFLKKRDLVQRGYATADEVERLDTLRRLRNAVSHGTRPDYPDTRKLLSSPDATDEFLRASMGKVRSLADDLREDDALRAEVRNYIDEKA
jgi:CRISPR-associated Csx2 family protein